MGAKKKQRVPDEVSLIPFTAWDKRKLFFKSVAAVLILDYFFYQSFIALFPLLWVGMAYYKMEKRFLFQQKKEQVREQFKELMLLVSTGQKAGFSAENSFLSSYEDMKALYGRESTVCRMIRLLGSGRENNRSFSELWKQIGRQLEIREIMEFACIYEISQKSSGNMAAVMEKTASMIIQRIETEKEIRVLLSARRLEQRIMNATPFMIMFYISITSPGYFAGLYHSLAGALIMSLCLLVYLGAYLLSTRIAAIEIE